MKTHLKTGLFAILFMAGFAFSALHAQDVRTIRGVVSDESGPLESVNIVLKGSNSGTTTNRDGEFTFPRPLKAGDILLFSFLGYNTQQVAIKPNQDFIELTLNDDVIEVVGAPSATKPYKSKRSN